MTSLYFQMERTMSNLQLSIQTGTQAGQTFQLQNGSQTIGRAPTNSIVIAESTISKQHAEITVQPEGVWIQDLGSSNGTFVNGKPISQSTWLKPGDTLQFGTSVVVGVQGTGTAATSSGNTGWIIALVALIVVLLLVGLGLGGLFLWRARTVVPPTASPTAQVVESVPPTDIPAQPPLVDFTASKTLVPLGECLTLRWNVNYAQEVRLDGELIPEQGERTVCPQESGKMYRLTILSLNGETSEDVISVTVPPTPPPPPNVALEFSADQATVEYGSCTTLRWSIENAEAIRLNGEKVGSQGSKEVCPTEPGNAYQLLVLPLQGDLIEQNIIINVPPTPLPPSPTPAPTPTTASQAQTTQAPIIDKLIADQTTLNQGGCTSLRWTVRNANAVQLSGGDIGNQSVGNQGATRVCPPSANTTYTLVASNAGGSVQTSITLAVIAPTPTTVVIAPQPQPQLPVGEPVISISATVGYIDGDERCFTLQGFIENVREAYLNGGKYNNEPLTGPVWTKKVCHKNTTTYRMTAVLHDGSTKTVEISRSGP